MIHKQSANAQINIFDEIFVDNFAGGGGASTGIELAIGRPVNIAINHDPAAILMHKTNHPYTRHLQESVWDIDPVKECGGQPVGLAWFSPDCKHFSKAKGGKPVEKKIRGLAWIVLKWAGLVRPRVIILENVEEFQTWGPVRKGKPVKSKIGQTFEKWKSQLAALGYEIEHRELVAADYGTPTTRKRFFLIARCDGRPIIWPEPTHAPAESEDVKNGKKKPWRSAAEIIDWSLPCPSIFSSKAEIKEQYGLTAVRPLANNTLRRIIRGVDKFVLHSANPFIVQVNHSGDFRGQSMGDPMQTVTAKHGTGVVDPMVAPYHMHNHSNAVGTDMRNPVNTVTSCGQQMLITPSLIPIGYGVRDGQAPRVHDIESPLPTAVSSGKHYLSTPCLIQYHTEQSEKVRGQGMDEPIMTVDAANRYGLAMPLLTEYYSGADHAGKANAPLHTSTTRDRQGLVMAHIAEFKGQDKGQAVNVPLRTITASAGEFGAVYTTLEKVRPGVNLGYWPKIRNLLNEYCGYEIADDEILLIWIAGVAYYLADIGLRMLAPKELYAANGFPADYIIDRDYMGNEYKKTDQVARCGNAVCPQMATALVRANLPEYCQQIIMTMAQLHDCVAV